MATIDDLPLWIRAALKLYRWRRIAPTPITTLVKPLSECRVALVTTAGLVAAGDIPFDEGVRGGDWSFRVIAGDVDVRALGEFHRSESFDHGGIEADRNVGFLLDRLPNRRRRHDRRGRAATPSFMGLDHRAQPPRPAQRLEAAELLVNDEVDLALLVPV